MTLKLSSTFTRKQQVNRKFRKKRHKYFECAKYRSIFTYSNSSTKKPSGSYTIIFKTQSKVKRFRMSNRLNEMDDEPPKPTNNNTGGEKTAEAEEDKTRSIVGRRIPTWLSTIDWAFRWLIYLYEMYRKYSI